MLKKIRDSFSLNISSFRDLFCYKLHIPFFYTLDKQKAYYKRLKKIFLYLVLKNLLPFFGISLEQPLVYRNGGTVQKNCSLPLYKMGFPNNHFHTQHFPVYCYFHSYSEYT